MNPGSYIARKYLHGPRERSRALIHIISRIASLGIVITAMALFVVLSGFSGLRRFNIDLMDSTGPDLRILPGKGKTFVWSPALAGSITRTGLFSVIAPVVEEKVYLRYGNKQTVAVMRGVDSTYKPVIRADSILVDGDWPRNDWAAVAMGNALANKLSVRLNDYKFPVTLMVPAPGSSPLSGAFRQRSLLVSGIYQNTLDFENRYIFVPLPIARDLLGLQAGRVSYVDLELAPGVDLETARQQLQKLLPGELTLTDKYRMNRSLFKMLNSENLITYLVGAFIMLIAVFNVTGAIIILILYKKRDRFILSALGMTPVQIRNVFFRYGFRMVMLSGLTGLVLGLLLVGMQKHFGWLNVPGTTLVYPVEIRLTNILIVLGTVALLAWLSARFASRFAKRSVDLRP